MEALDITMDQILHAMRRAEILEFSEDPAYARRRFTAKLLSSGEEFFVPAAVEILTPFQDSHVVIGRIWR